MGAPLSESEDLCDNSADSESIVVVLEGETVFEDRTDGVDFLMAIQPLTHESNLKRVGMSRIEGYVGTCSFTGNGAESQA
jgi:hypothetical protein